MTKGKNPSVETEQTTAVQPAPSTGGAIAMLADRLGVEATGLFMQSLKNVAFKSPNVTNDQLMALVVVANQYKLNPFTRELYAFPDRSGGIVPIVSVDGWFRIINEHPQLDGIEYHEVTDESGKTYGEAAIFRKDRAHPTIIREYLDEVRRNTDPWKQHTHRMLRHKTIIQAARVAFGFAGIYDPDEGERVIQSQRVVSVVTGASGADRIRQLLDAAPASDFAPDTEAAPPVESVARVERNDDDELPL